MNSEFTSSKSFVTQKRDSGQTESTTKNYFQHLKGGSDEISVKKTKADDFFQWKDTKKFSVKKEKIIEEKV